MPPDPLILAFDTSAAHVATALLLGDQVLAERTEDMHKGQAERLFPLLEEILTETGNNWADLAAIGVGVGPGNFTGIRLSVAAARGLALSLGIPAVGVSTFEALAVGLKRPVLAAVDARRGQTFLRLFDEPMPPITATIDSLEVPPALRLKNAVYVGTDLGSIADEIGAKWSNPRYSLPVAIAKLTAGRFTDTPPRLAPLYIRQADAKLSSEPAPVILS